MLHFSRTAKRLSLATKRAERSDERATVLERSVASVSGWVECCVDEIFFCLEIQYSRPYVVFFGEIDKNLFPQMESLKAELLRDKEKLRTAEKKQSSLRERLEEQRHAAARSEKARLLQQEQQHWQHTKERDLEEEVAALKQVRPSLRTGPDA